ncbi:MAG: DNA methyltransferase [Chloroflexota bacterium]
MTADDRRPDPEGQAPVTSEFSDIDLRRWKERSDIILDSLWLLGARAKDGPHAPDYWGNFVPQIPRQVLQRFTRRGELAVDLFSGMGTTLIECRHLGRHGIGLELNPAVAERSRERIAEAANSDGTTTSVLVGDATSPAGLAAVQAALASAGREHADCVFLHPPYFDIIRFGEDPRDLSNAPTLDTFLAGFRGAVANAYALLRPRRFLALVIGDIYDHSDLVPLGFACMQVCREVGFRLRAINVKDIQGNERGKGKNENLWRYRALKQGFYIFKHEYVMIFRKP